MGKKDFIWWIDLNMLDFDQVADSSTLRDYFKGRVCNGESLGFWRFIWIGYEFICTQFPDLYRRADRKKVKV